MTGTKVLLSRWHLDTDHDLAGWVDDGRQPIQPRRG